MGNDNTPRNSNKKKSKKPPTKDFIQSYNSLLTNNTYNPNAFCKYTILFSNYILLNTSILQ